MFFMVYPMFFYVLVIILTSSLSFFFFLNIPPPPEISPLPLHAPFPIFPPPPRKRPHCARRIFLNPRTGPGTRCDFGQNGQTNRVPCAFAIRSTMTDQPGLHSLYRTGSSGTTTAFFTIGRTSFVLLLLARFAVRFTGRLRRPAARVVRVARIVSALAGLSCLHRPVSRLSKLLVLTSCAGRCSCPCACCFSSSSPVSGTPTGSADDCPLPCLRRRRADGRRDS